MNSACLECGAQMKLYREDYSYASLPGTILRNAAIWRCSKCKAWEVEIPRPLDLERALAAILLRKSARLTGKETRFLRKYLGLSGADLAQKMDVTRETISRWEQGHKPISANKDRFLRLMVATEQPVQNYFKDLETVATEEPSAPSLYFEDRGGKWELCAA